MRFQQCVFVGYAADDKMRMFVCRREELAGGFDGGVDRLDGLLRWCKVAPNDDVEVADLRFSVTVVLSCHGASPCLMVEEKELAAGGEPASPE